MKEAIIENISLIKKRIREAAQKAQRNDDVQLLLATKTVAADNIRIALEAGEWLVGENKVQEFKIKLPQLADLAFQKHFIGHLQTNKIKEVLRYVDCIQSVDRIDLVEKLDQRLQFEGRSISVFIQINTSFEESKFGVHPDDALKFLKYAVKYDTLEIKGLMTIGLFDTDAEKTRKSFTLLRQIRDNAINEGILMPAARHLSMGMSSDMETAIEEGATIVRVGTAIFGKRLYPDSYYWNETL